MKWNIKWNIKIFPQKKKSVCRYDDKKYFNYYVLKLCTFENTVSPNIFLVHLSFFKNVYGFNFFFTLIQDKKKICLASKIVREFKKNIKYCSFRIRIMWQIKNRTINHRETFCNLLNIYVVSALTA